MNILRTIYGRIVLIKFPHQLVIMSSKLHFYEITLKLTLIFEQLNKILIQIEYNYAQSE